MPTVLSNEPKSWVERHLDGVMVPAAIGYDIEFDEAKDCYRNKQDSYGDPTREYDTNQNRSDQGRAKIYGQALAERSKLLAIMNRFRISMEKSTGVQLDESGLHTWNDVMKLMEDNKAAYLDKKESAGVQAINIFFAKLGDRGETFSAWLELLPSGEYSSVICGAFKLVIKASAKAKAHRDSVFEALGNIPATLAVSKQYIRMWPDPLVDSAFSKLYIAILEFFTYTLNWLSKSGLNKAMKAFVKQDQYGQESKELISAVKARAKEIRQQAEICMHRGIKGINGNVNQLQNLAVGISNDVGNLKVSAANAERMLAAFSGDIPKKIVNTLYKLIQGRQRDHERSRSKIPAIGFEATKKGNQRRPNQALKECLQSRAAERLSPDWLHEIIGYDPQLEERAVSKSWSEGATFILQDQERIEGLLSSQPFQDWYNSPISRLLLVNCEADPVRISPASVACALLAKSLADNGTITLSFFCGLYDDPRNPDTGAKQMLANLVGQLLEKYQDFDLSFLEPSQRRALEKHDAHLLCVVLITLLRQLPRECFVFLLLDGVSFYETSKLGNDLLGLVSALKDLVERDKYLEAVVKVVLTSPGASQRVSRMLNQNQVFSLEDNIELTGQGSNPMTCHRLTESSLIEQSRSGREDSWGSSSDQGSTESEESEVD